jgi:uncharacterized protein
MSHLDPPETTSARASRPWLLAFGWLLFSLGFVGIFLPVLPTTIFWIGAVWCWSRSAPHLARRILSHPRFGKPIHQFIERGEMTRHGKLAAIGGIAIGYLLFQLTTQPAWLPGLLVAAILALVGAWLWSRPEPANGAAD